MSRKSSIGFIILYCIGAMISNSEDKIDIATPPSPPYLAALPDRSRWSISYDFPSNQTLQRDISALQAPPTPLKVKKIEITRDGDLRRQVMTWADGSVSEAWVSGIYLISTFPQKNGIYITRNVGFLDASVKNQFPNPQFPDFPELSWLSSETYTIVTEFRGIPCYVFMRNISDQPMPGALKESGKQTAWIDVRTHLPVAFKSGDFIQTYSFGKGEPISLALPSALSAALQEYKSKLPTP